MTSTNLDTKYYSDIFTSLLLAPFTGVCPSSYIFGCCWDGSESLTPDKSDCNGEFITEGILSAQTEKIWINSWYNYQYLWIRNRSSLKFDRLPFSIQHNQGRRNDKKARGANAHQRALYRLW